MSDLDTLLEKGLQTLQEKVHNLFAEQRKSVEDSLAEVKKAGAVSAETEEKLNKLGAVFDRLDELKKKQSSQDDIVNQLKELLGGIESELARGRDSKKSAIHLPGRESEEYKSSINSWCRASYYGSGVTGTNALNEEQKGILDKAANELKQLQLVPEQNGGFLAPLEFVREILRDVLERTEIRQLVRVRQTMLRGIQVPRQTGRGGARWVSENGTKADTGNPTYGMDEIPTHEIYALLDISNWMAEDAIFDMENEIRTDASDQFALEEGRVMILGNGVGQPEGLLNHTAGVDVIKTGSADSIADADGQGDGLIRAFYELKTFYARNARWLMNRRTIGAVRRLKTEDGQYLWQPGLATDRPSTILDAPYSEVPDMPDVAAGSIPIMLGDWYRAYTLVDRLAMEFLRDIYTQAPNGNVRYIFRKRIGGKVMMPEAYLKVQVGTNP